MAERELRTSDPQPRRPASEARSPGGPASTLQHGWPQRLLVIGLSNIGDAILMADVVATLHDHYPRAHLTVVVGDRARMLFADDPRIQTLVNIGEYDSVIGHGRLALALWRYQPQIVVDLRHTLYPLLLKPLSAWRYLLRPPKALAHMRDRHLWTLLAQAPRLVRKLQRAGAVPGRHAAPLSCGARDPAHVEALVKRWQLDRGRPLVVICPGARSHIKRWTAEGFAAVADRLIAEAQAQVVLSGETEEEPIIEAIVGMMHHPARSSVGLLTIRQLGLLMQRAALVVTNDSASLHLASAQRIPTVALFGPTDAAKYGPTAPVSRTIRRRLVCAPCEEASCRFHHECMRFISADDVCAAAKDLLRDA